MAFNLNDRKGAYGEVEAIKSSKFKIKRDQTLITYGLCALAIGIIIFIFFEEPTADLLFYSPIKLFTDQATNAHGIINKEKQIFLDGYKKLLILLIFGLYCGFCIVSKKFYKSKNSILSWFAKPFSLLSQAVLNNIVQVPKDLEPKIGFNAAWLEKLDKDFFNQVVKQQDGYKRAKELKIFHDMPYIFGDIAHENIKRLFINDESFDDLFKILEGYLQNGLYDELWIDDNDVVTKEYKENKQLDIPNSKIYENFKAYAVRKGYQEIKNTLTNTTEKLLVDKDSVVFSRNALKIFTQKHTFIFYKYLAQTILISEKFEYNPMLVKLINALKNDISFRTKIKKYYDQQSQELFFNIFDNGATNLIDNEQTKAMLLEMLSADFMLIAFKSVVERYMGLPSGLLVSKIADYDTRMILETYTRKVLIKIVPAKNDGSTAIYNSDNYTNLFIFLLTSYFDNEKHEFFQELQDKFNTDIHEVPKREIQ